MAGRIEVKRDFTLGIRQEKTRRSMLAAYRAAANLGEVAMQDGLQDKRYLEKSGGTPSESAMQQAIRLVAVRFPRIAQEIRARWGKDGFDDYVDKLLIDDRGGRAGFPPDVAEALLILSREHGQRFPRASAKANWIWSDPALHRR